MNPHHHTPAGRPRARFLGIPFDGTPGPYNAITDVPGLEVGYCTLIRGSGALEVGVGPVRTGVTAILPRGRADAGRPVVAGSFSMNGNGELTGTAWMAETGRCDGPITLTNTHSCGLTRDATVQWLTKQPGGLARWALPVAGETFDGWLNDINGFHVRPEHVFEALDGARGGRIEEGSVGGGTGMICYGFKGGSGTASRVVPFADAVYTVGAFVQTNFGRPEHLLIAGVPVGKALATAPADPLVGQGSIIVVIATDAPLLPHQLPRLARRVALGVGRSGAIAGHNSGDLFMALSTGNAEALHDEERLAPFVCVPDGRLDPFFTAVIEATDEAILNALVANEPMVGVADRRIEALPHERVQAVLSQYGRLTPSQTR